MGSPRSFATSLRKTAHCSPNATAFRRTLIAGTEIIRARWRIRQPTARTYVRLAI